MMSLMNMPDLQAPFSSVFAGVTPSLTPTLAAGSLTPYQITSLFLAIALLLGFSRLFGEISRRFKQPMVLGEILAGILLGPTILGAISPDLFHYFFPTPPEPGEHADAAFISLEFLKTLAAALLLFSAGLEVDLGVALKQGKSAVLVSMVGIIFPFTAGATAAWFMPDFLGAADGAQHLPFALFVGIAISITALPVIAKILLDLNMFKSDIGMLIMSAAMLNDLVGWIVFAIILAMIGGGSVSHQDESNAAKSPSGQTEMVIQAAPESSTVDTAAAPVHDGPGMETILTTIGLAVTFMVFFLTAVRIVFHRLMPFIQAHTSWPGGVLATTLVVTLIAAACTEYIGIHSIFGAFIAGVAVGDSHHLREKTRSTINDFITNIFAPLFFATIGLSVNFVTSFDLTLVLTIIGIGATGKVLGSFLGARLSGLSNNVGGAVAFGMGAQGAMGIIFGQLALQAGLITDELFVAIVVMSLFTSLISAPMMQKLLRRKQEKHLADMMSEKGFISWLGAHSTLGAIQELSVKAAAITKIDVEVIENSVWEREQLMSTGIGDRMAVPHARLKDLKTPVICVGRSEAGIDFNAADGRVARIIFLLLTPESDQTSQIELLRMIAEAFGDEPSREKALSAKTYTEFLAATRLPGEVAGSHAHG